MPKHALILTLTPLTSRNHTQTMPHFFLFLFLFLISHPNIHITTAFPENPSIIFPSSSSNITTTIPAFPEQSDVSSTASSSCPLTPSPSLLPYVIASCSSSGGSTTDNVLMPRHHCCPALATWLYAAYANTTLTVPVGTTTATSAVGLPVPPEDAEACAASAELGLRDGGAHLPRVNGSSAGTCDVAFCYCGIRLRRLACGTGGGANGRWAPPPEMARRLEKECRRVAGVKGCSRCLRALDQLKSSNNATAAIPTADATTKQAEGRNRDCQLMGLTWLLARNATLYRAAATSVLVTLMAADEAAVVEPTSCSLSIDDYLPLAVGSSEINGCGGSSTMPLLSVLAFHMLLLVMLSFFF